MVRAMLERAPCAGVITVRMPRSRVEISPGARALWRRTNRATPSVTATMAASRSFCLMVVTGLLHRDFAEERELVEGAAGAEHHRAFGRVRHHHRQAGLLAQQDVEV